jgi:Icc-related predicted phosphoesterase
MDAHCFVQEIRPKAHLFGHVHDTPGTRAIEGVTFINAATHISRKTHYFDYYVRPS